MPARTRSWSTSVLAVALLAGSATAPAAAVTPADGPPGFWYATDSSYIHVSGPPPYQEPVIGGGSYGGYFGMYGNWARQAGCGKIVVWSSTNSAEAHTNHVTYHRGVGVGGYWFMGGPGVDPNYNGTTSEAYSWGARQAAWTLTAMAARPVTYPVVFADIELPGHSPSYTPADDNGWNSVYTSACSGQVRIGFVPVNVDRATLNGYSAYITAHSSYFVGVYSAPDVWTSIFGTGTASRIPNTYEWTYESFTASLSHHPYGWCLSGTHTCARFFGGQTSGSRYALMWQWSGGGGSYNGYGDFDQLDATRTPH
jgi:hypothetical protein